MKRPITADEVRNFFRAANKQFEEAGFFIRTAQFKRNEHTGELTDILLSYENRKRIQGSKDITIGAYIQHNGKRYLCQEAKNDDCDGCDFIKETDNCECPCYCSSEYRKDGKNVLFKEAEEAV